MEFEDVSEEVEWEALRIATAFQVKEIKKTRLKDLGKTRIFFSGNISSEILLTFTIDEVGELESAALDYVDIEEKYSTVDKKDKTWALYDGDGKLGEILARSLYLVGFDDEKILKQLPPFSDTEKLELRLSMPREFWPKTWLDEEGRKGNS